MSSRPSRGAARLAAILDALPDALLLVNCNGTVVNANTIALEMFETPGTALVGRGLLDLLPTFDSKRIPGSMRRPDDATHQGGRQKPTRMIARRTDGTELLVEVTSANLEDGRTPYESAFEAAYADHRTGYTGNELLMLVVRDISGQLDIESELARQQRQTEMILRAAAEGVVGVDAEGKVVLVNPSAAQILGYRASELGGKELHPLIHHSRADGTPLPWAETPLADTLKSGRKHRVRGQVLWAKDGRAVSVDLTTAPVRDGDQLVGAVMTFTDRRPMDAMAARQSQLLAVLDRSLRGPLEELRAELGTLASDPAGQLWPEANQVLHHLTAGYSRMTTLVDNVLSYQQLDAGTDKLQRTEVSLDTVVAAGVEGAVELIGPGRAQFAVHAPPIEAEVDAARLAQALSHLIADVAGVDSTGNTPAGAPPAGDSTIVVAAAQRGSVVRIEVRGPYSGGDPVHGPIVRGIVRLHGGVLQTHEVPGGAGGSAYVLEVPVKADGSAVPAGHQTAGSDGTVETPAAGAGTPTPAGGTDGGTAGGRRRARGGTDGADATAGDGTSESTGRGVPAAPNGSDGRGTGGSTGGTPVDPRAHAGMPGAEAVPPGGRRRGRPEAESAGSGLPALPAAAGGEQQGRPAPQQPGGRRARRALSDTAGRALPEQVPPHGTGQAPDAAQQAAQGGAGQQPSQSSASALTPAAGPGRPAPGQPHGGRPGQDNGQAQPGGQGPAGLSPARAGGAPAAPAGQQGPRTPFALPPAAADQQPARVPQPQAPQQPGAQQPRPALPASGGQTPGGPVQDPRAAGAQTPGRAPSPGTPQLPAQAGPAGPEGAVPAGTGRRRARRAPEQEATGTDAGARGAALPAPHGAAGQAGPAAGGEWDAPTGRRRARRAAAEERAAAAMADSESSGTFVVGAEGQVTHPEDASAATAAPAPTGRRRGRPSPAEAAGPQAQEAPAGRQPEAGAPGDAGQGTGQGGPQTNGANGANGQGGPQGSGAHAPSVPGPRRSAPGEQPAGQPGAAGPLPLPEEEGGPAAGQSHGRAFSVRTLGQGVPFSQQIADQHQPANGRPGRHGQPAAAGDPNATGGGNGTLGGGAGSGRRRKLAAPPQDDERGTGADTPPAARGQGAQPHPPLMESTEGRAFAISAPDEGQEGPEPLDGPNGAIEVVDRQPPPMDDELPPEPLDNPRRLLVWPAPDPSTQQALSDRGYRPVIVNSREEVDAQIAAYPAALFVDPLTGPITRKALQSLRQAAGAAEVPVLVTAGLAQATREAAYGADPAVLLKALAPRDSEQHPPRVLLIEENDAVAGALTASLERRGMQVARAATDADAVSLATQVAPNLVVMDLMQVRRRRAGIVDWLRANGLLARTPLVVYTSAEMDPAQLPRLVSGETVLFLAERSTSQDVQGRIVDLLAKIGTN
ncbi:PAS domain S-box protein [Streptomyces sp. Ru73]|uniref:PAS domain-containing protein n=1 Tax=Streptomyces sp. Ru73 TaxID=2080748 RepID=UPI000CDD1EB2|nr:PAS domain-containing protein [Streptomyces sp. Ru73]POX37807.1 PAS domain S-box protein [Streptomyces sp. Ru73]